MRSKLFVLALAGVGIAAAQVDPPGQVARLNYLDGSVSFQPAGMEDWVPATLNRPLTTGDRLWSDSESRAEMHLPSAALRLASRTAFQFLNLDDRNVQVSLTEGTLSVHLWSLAEDETFEVDTPNLSFVLLRPGDYRIDADPDAQATVVTARQGQGEGTGRGDAFNLRPGEQARVSGEDTIGYNVVGAPEPDGWDRWCMDRTEREERAVSANYVGRDVIGYEDLDQYGSWGSAPDYGPIWTPRAMPVGWAPYRYGHWAWIEPWGWTWVDDAPWGFAPFHYGRWAYFGGGWAWVPGPAGVGVGRHMAVRPVYSPALVAWIGGAHWGVSVSAGGGPVGWVPLGPREVFVPGYRASSTYVTRVNTTNTVINNVDVTNIYNANNVTRVNYVNQRAPNAVTAISAADMASARPVRQVAMNVNAQQLSSAQVLMAAPVAPRREGVLGRPVQAQAVRPPSRVFEREVVARTAPPPSPVPFSQRRVVLDRNPGRPIDATTMQQLRMSATVSSARPQAAVVVPSRPEASPRQGQPSQPNEAGSWRTPDRPQSQTPVRNPVPSYRSDPAAAQPHINPQAAPTVQQPYPANDGWRRNESRPPQSAAPAQSTVPGYRSQPSANPAAPAVRQAPVSPQEAPVSRPEAATPSVRQPPPAAPAMRQMPVNRNESGERTPHPQGGQAQKAPVRNAEPKEKPRGESK